MAPSMAITHPTLGVAGVRKIGVQPLCGVYVSGSGVSPAFFRPEIPAVTSANNILMNPILLGGPLSVEAYLYDKFVFRKFAVKFTTFVETTQRGVCVLAIEKDVANISATTFNGARMVTPNVTFPYRIPKAELDWRYDGPDTFYTNPSQDEPTEAQARQDWQGILTGYDSNIAGVIPPGGGTFMGWLDIEYEIDFFDPVPPTLLVGSTTHERAVLAAIRSAIAKKIKTAGSRIPTERIELGTLMDEPAFEHSAANAAEQPSDTDSIGTIVEQVVAQIATPVPDLRSGFSRLLLG